MSTEISSWLRNVFNSVFVCGTAFYKVPLRGVEAAICGDHLSPCPHSNLSYFEVVFSFRYKLIVHQGAGRLINKRSVISGHLESPCFLESCKLYYFDSH